MQPPERDQRSSLNERDAASFAAERDDCLVKVKRQHETHMSHLDFRPETILSRQEEQPEPPSSDVPNETVDPKPAKSVSFAPDATEADKDDREDVGYHATITQFDHEEIIPPAPLHTKNNKTRILLIVVIFILGITIGAMARSLAPPCSNR